MEVPPINLPMIPRHETSQPPQRPHSSDQVIPFTKSYHPFPGSAPLHPAPMSVSMSRLDHNRVMLPMHSHQHHHAIHANTRHREISPLPSINSPFMPNHHLMSADGSIGHELMLAGSCTGLLPRTASTDHHHSKVGHLFHAPSIHGGTWPTATGPISAPMSLEPTLSTDGVLRLAPSHDHHLYPNPGPQQPLRANESEDYRLFQADSIGNSMTLMPTRSYLDGTLPAMVPNPMMQYPSVIGAMPFLHPVTGTPGSNPSHSGHREAPPFPVLSLQPSTPSIYGVTPPELRPSMTGVIPAVPFGPILASAPSPSILSLPACTKAPTQLHASTSSPPNSSNTSPSFPKTLQPDPADEMPDFSTFRKIPLSPMADLDCRQTDTAKGLGVFTKRDFTFGELLLTDTSLMVMPVRVREKNLLRKFVQLPREEQEKVMSLTNIEDDDEASAVQQLHRVAKYNRVDLFMTNHQTQKLSRSGRGLYQWLSKINHSCTPNAFVLVGSDAIVRDSLVTSVFAMRNIRSGEEITISYVWVGVMKPFAVGSERAKFLSEQFQFDCLCDVCDLTTERGIRVENQRQSLQTNHEAIEAFINKGDITRAYACAVDSLKMMLGSRDDYLQFLTRAFLQVYRLAEVARILHLPVHLEYPPEHYLTQASAIATVYCGHWLTMVHCDSQPSSIQSFAEEIRIKRFEAAQGGARRATIGKGGSRSGAQGKSTNKMEH